MTYGFLEVLSPNPLKKDTAALSTCGQVTSRSDATCVAEDEFAPFFLQCFLPVLCVGYEECIQHLLSHPRYLGSVAFSVGFPLIAVRAAPS